MTESNYLNKINKDLRDAGWKIEEVTRSVVEYNLIDLKMDFFASSFPDTLDLDLYPEKREFDYDNVEVSYLLKNDTLGVYIESDIYEIQHKIREILKLPPMPKYWFYDGTAEPKSLGDLIVLTSDCRITNLPNGEKLQHLINKLIYNSDLTFLELESEISKLCLTYHVFADPKIEDYKAFNLKNNLDEFVNLK